MIGWVRRDSASGGSVGANVTVPADRLADVPHLRSPTPPRSSRLRQISIARTREASDTTPRYDVIDAAGKVVSRVALPVKTRVVGFGNGVVYTVRTDEDDLQYLQRFRLP